ncbi:PH domain-containing protein [Sulfolobus sp. S-194]|uniref:PH domain-containing protein n=1 Tax=Sulfolobus sp. S-194 TaxID=2512240 RepID=UPI00143729EF|nr:PH domain-containing protein [Sulfolobus sp. S-194]QIW22731.1 PH domain-containing protein [Sulfolobus sp. S-194]
MLVTKPTITKTIVKGTILILIFSLFLDFYKIFDFILFLLIIYSLLFLYIIWKRMHTYEFSESEIIIKTPFSSKKIMYSSIDDAFFSIGFLAKRFHCGSIYLILKDRKVEIIRDIPNPEEAFEILKKKVI